MAPTLLLSALVLASHTSLPVAAERDVFHITSRQPTGIASTPGDSAPKKIDADRWPALMANPDETGVYPVPGFDVSQPYRGEPMHGWTVTLAVKRSIPGEGVVETGGSDDHVTDGEFEAHHSSGVCASTITLSRREDRDLLRGGEDGSCGGILSEDCVRRINEAPGVGRSRGAPRLDRLPDECSLNPTAATSPTAYGYSL
ncbi:hypothetical protein DL769_006185 [Monosporascus sp. CRB-8-3]|nr:hypothetical protein DL769_006185 [Monosporascus sp. CRB-8-3]